MERLWRCPRTILMMKTSGCVVRAFLPALTLIAACSIAVAATPPVIHRLDDTTIPIVEAEAFAKKTLEANHVTGAQIAVLDHGQLVWSAAFGLRRKATDTTPALPMDTWTTLWAASITKSVFATYVMQLVERGEFDLGLPISRQLPQSLDTYEP
jgi:CubicO group peptidase (beta-lactamase class C family)